MFKVDIKLSQEKRWRSYWQGEYGAQLYKLFDLSSQNVVLPCVESQIDYLNKTAVDL